MLLVPRPRIRSSPPSWARAYSTGVAWTCSHELSSFGFRDRYQTVGPIPAHLSFYAALFIADCSTHSDNPSDGTPPAGHASHGSVATFKKPGMTAQRDRGILGSYATTSKSLSMN